jgi:DNA/RNA-binding domain of Phe-tRNA-synthetase-like protein
MLLRVVDAIFTQFPGTILGVVIAHGIDNGGENSDVLGLLHSAEAKVVAELAGAQLAEHPHIAPWRAAYRAFGAKPKEYPSSIENLVRRVLKGQALPHINTLVDLYNTVSLRWLLPVGGEDLDTVEGDVVLTFASDHEAPVRLLGERDERPPYPREVIYKDTIGTLCRRWNWKEADRTKLTAGTRNAFLVIEGLPPVEAATIERATNDLAELVRAYCGGAITTAIVDERHPQADLGAIPFK